jgi:2'-5' RNA ligase
MRLFVALELTPEVHAAVRAVVERLRRADADLRWVRPEGMHLTLKFIGEVPPEKLGPIQEALAAVQADSPVELHFRELGYFPNPKRPRVLWIGVDANPSLAPLAAQIEARLAPLGVAPEKRAYVPHLTLGRFRSEKRLARLQEEIAGLAPTDFGRFETRTLALFQSKLSPHGAEYTRLGEFTFVRGG